MMVVSSPTVLLTPPRPPTPAITSQEFLIGRYDAAMFVSMATVSDRIRITGGRN